MPKAKKPKTHNGLLRPRVNVPNPLVIYETENLKYCGVIVFVISVPCIVV
jgi:hypothetical protein